MISSAVRERYLHEGLITALSIGGFLIILGFVFAFTPGIAEQTSNFFNDLTFPAYPLSSSSTISLLAPANPADHQGFYTAVINFLLAVGILQIVILVLRLAVHSRIRRIAQSFGDVIFWLGAALTANIFLLTGTLNGWYQFWALLLILIGTSLIARFFVYLTLRHTRYRNE
jgi:hypothetical protein